MHNISAGSHPNPNNLCNDSSHLPSWVAPEANQNTIKSLTEALNKQHNTYQNSILWTFLGLSVSTNGATIMMMMTTMMMKKSSQVSRAGKFKKMKDPKKRHPHNNNAAQNTKAQKFYLTHHTTTTLG
jgi:hypothetical protein